MPFRVTNPHGLVHAYIQYHVFPFQEEPRCLGSETPSCPEIETSQLEVGLAEMRKRERERERERGIEREKERKRGGRGKEKMRPIKGCTHTSLMIH